ncbi:TPA: Tc toxin subunit A, partial [Pseudomonas putida]
MASPDAAVHDYKEWFGGRAAKFAAPGSVASMFSPAAYLAALYREAKKLYPAGNAWHIDTRRPDLKNLVLSQVNLDTPVSALSLSNAILMERLGEHGDTLEGLSNHVGLGATPYHHQHNRLRQAYRLKDPDFKHLWAATDVSKHVEAPSLAGLCHDIPPALY